MSFIDDIKKPINLLSITLGIAGLIWGVYSYLDSKKERMISYQTNSSVVKIYDAENSSSAIKLVEKDSVTIKQNVYLLTGVVWNSGGLPITQEDVRQTLSINLQNASRILDYRIMNEHDREIAGFALRKNSEEVIEISWKYFDPGFGFSYQILYIGQENPQMTLNAN